MRSQAKAGARRQLTPLLSTKWSTSPPVIPALTKVVSRYHINQMSEKNTQKLYGHLVISRFALLFDMFFVFPGSLYTVTKWEASVIKLQVWRQRKLTS